MPYEVPVVPVGVRSGDQNVTLGVVTQVDPAEVGAGTTILHQLGPDWVLPHYLNPRYLELQQATQNDEQILVVPTLYLSFCA